MSGRTAGSAKSKQWMTLWNKSRQD